MPQGELTLELSRGVDRFQARWDLGTGTCTLCAHHGGGRAETGEQSDGAEQEGNLSAALRQRRSSVWWSGWTASLPFDNGVTYRAAGSSGSAKENDLDKPASIGVHGAGVAVRKLKLFRDTYYTVGGVKEGTSPHEADVRIDPTDP